MQEGHRKGQQNTRMNHQDARTYTPRVDGHAGMGHGGMDDTELASKVTKPQLLVVTALTLLALAAAALCSRPNPRFFTCLALPCIMLLCTLG